MDKKSGRIHRLRPGEAYAAGPLIGTRRFSASYCRLQSMAAMPRRAACGLAPLASHRAMNWGETSTSSTLDGWSYALGLDMTAFCFARHLEWTTQAIQRQPNADS